jgi:hypothetical protein
MAAFDIHERVVFDAVGAWSLRYVLEGNVLADGPLRVVAQSSAARNRPPSAVAVSVTTRAGVAQCVVASPLVARDPDYDVVRYRYRWSAGGKTLRAVTSAALSDELPLPAARAVRCDVTPSDGKLSARTVSAAG